MMRSSRRRLILGLLLVGCAIVLLRDCGLGVGGVRGATATTGLVRSSAGIAGGRSADVDYVLPEQAANDCVVLDI